MKKQVLILLIQAFAIGVFAQSEPYVKALKKLEYGSTVLDAAMLFKKDFPNFKSLTEGKGPVLLTVFTNPYDAAQKFKIEAYFLVNEKDQQLVQLFYVNDALYEKGAYWYFHKDSVDAVEKKYMKCNNTFISNPMLLSIEGGSVKSEEEKYELGRKTHYPVQKQGKNSREGMTGYELIYEQGAGARGFWVYMQAFNTFESGLDTSMDFPHMKPPKGVFTELAELLTASQQ
jgi:hypothetical protein